MDTLLPNYHLLLEDDAPGYSELMLINLTVQADHCYGTAWLTAMQLLQGNEQVLVACMYCTQPRGSAQLQALC